MGTSARGPQAGAASLPLNPLVPLTWASSSENASVDNDPAVDNGGDSSAGTEDGAQDIQVPTHLRQRRAGAWRDPRTRRHPQGYTPEEEVGGLHTDGTRTGGRPSAGWGQAPRGRSLSGDAFRHVSVGAALRLPPANLRRLGRGLRGQTASADPPQEIQLLQEPRLLPLQALGHAVHFPGDKGDRQRC